MRADGVLEYTRRCKVEGALLARIAFLCVIYAFLGFVTFMLTLYAGFVAFIISAAITVSVVAITKPFFTEQRDYEIVDGSFRIYKIYGLSLSRKAFECDMHSMELIAPYTGDGNIEKVRSVCDLLSDGSSLDAYYAVYIKNGEKHAVIFDGDEKFYAAARVHARRAFYRQTGYEPDMPENT